MDVSIIYVNYKTGQLIADSIRSVKEKTTGISYEIIVVDNHSEDDSLYFIHCLYPEVTCIELPENIGFGRANNCGLAQAKGTTIFFLNPDTLLVNNAVNILYNYLSRSDKTGVCGGNLVDAGLKPVNSFGRSYPSLLEELLSVYYLRRFYFCNFSSVHFNYTGKPMKVASIVGADMMVKRDVLELSGYFDPDFFMNFEETELCYRIRQHGYAVVSVPEAQIIHLEGQSPYINLSRVQRYFDGQYIFFFKRYGRKGPDYLYRLISLKCAFRKMLFTLLHSPQKIDYWQKKGDTNKQAYNSFLNTYR